MTTFWESAYHRPPMLKALKIYEAVSCQQKLDMNRRLAVMEDNLHDQDTSITNLKQDISSCASTSEVITLTELHDKTKQHFQGLSSSFITGSNSSTESQFIHHL